MCLYFINIIASLVGATGVLEQSDPHDKAAYLELALANNLTKYPPNPFKKVIAVSNQVIHWHIQEHKLHAQKISTLGVRVYTCILSHAKTTPAHYQLIHKLMKLL